MKNKNSIFWIFAFMLISNISFGQCPYIDEVRLWDNSWSNPLSPGPSQDNYSDFSNDCIPLFDTPQPQINIAASQGGVYMAMYADLDGDGLYETQIFSFYDANGLTGVNASSTLQPGTSIRIIVSDAPITTGDQRPNCGEMEEYVICGGDPCPFIENVRLWDNSWSNPTGESPNNYEDYTNDCIPLFTVDPAQINITASQGNIYRAVYADLDGNGTFEQQMTNQLDVNGSFGINLSSLPPGTPIRIIVSADPITSGDIIPNCGEAEDYVICGGEPCPYIENVRLWDNSWSNPTGESPNNYEDYTNDCIPLFTVDPAQINITASQGNIYRAIYADLDGNGTFEQQITNQLDVNGSFGINLSALPPGTPIRIIVSADPITSGDIIPNCGEAEDYVICADSPPCDCVNGGAIQTWNGPNCSIGFWLGGWGIDGCATLQPGFTWDFGDNTLPVTTSNNWTYHTYANPGTYTVTASFVVVNNKTGEPCTQTYTLEIKVDDCGKEGKSMSMEMPPMDIFNVNAFPNPSEDLVTFSVENPIKSIVGMEQPELVVYDQMGREVHRSSFGDASEKVVDFRSIGSGFYIYRITQDGQTLGSGELMIK